MKKLKKILVTAAVAVVAAVTAASFSACAEEDADYYIYMPDGAPALSMAMLLSEDMGFGSNVYYEVVDSSTIQTYVTGNDPQADVCILPINQAAQLLGSGDTYQMLGTVTHGNLYLLSKKTEYSGTAITTENLSSLKGKSVGVINLAAVPGLTFKTILNNAGIEYVEVTSTEEEVADKVNLYALSAASAVGGTDYDYYVLAEPAATTMTSRLEELQFVGSLQELYGSDNGYPQAVMVAKTSVIEDDPQFISDLIAAVTVNSLWLEVADVTTIVEAVTSHLTEGMSATFTADNLNAAVIENCAINFVSAADCRGEVLAFLEQYSEASGVDYSSYVSDAFFYGYAA